MVTYAAAVSGTRQYPIRQTIEKKPASTPKNIEFKVTRLAPMTLEKKTVAKMTWPSVLAYKPRILYLNICYLESRTI
jgi:hypothetical protein